MTPPAWLPDWTDLDAYPKPSVSLQEWAWQFLRRNPDYQANWNTLVEAFPAVLLSGWCASATTTAPLATCSMVALQLAGEPFGLKQLVDPAHQSLTGSMGWKGVGTFFLDAPLGTPMDFKLKVQPGEVYIRFNLNKPFAKQVEGANFVIEMLRTKTAKKPRSRRELFPVYLRVLDAQAAGVTRVEMGKVLSNALNSTDKIRNWLDQAARMRDSGYKDLLVIIDDP